jgi:AcrR family transcriptional regulator
MHVVHVADVVAMPGVDRAAIVEGNVALVANEEWIEAGLAELAGGGVDGVRVEVLARRLGVTKGGFYRRFRDRRALLDAMLAAWLEGRIAAIRAQTALDGEGPRARLAAIVSLFAARVNAAGLAIELAIRGWARTDEGAAAAVLRVDEERLDDVGRLYEELGLAAPEARARAALFYAFIFGQGLLILDSDPAERARLIDSCGELLGF